MTNEEKEQWLKENADKVTENRTDNGPYSVMDYRYWRESKRLTTRSGTPRKWLLGRVRRMIPTPGEHGFDSDDIAGVFMKVEI